MILDYHMHLRAPDGEIDLSVEAVVRFDERAWERGVDEIGFTEHVHVFEQTRDFWQLPYQTDQCRHDLDYLLGSVHWLYGEFGIDGAVGGGAWAEWPEEAVWSRYVAELSAAAGSGNFDVLSHPDLAKINGVRGSDERYQELAAAVDDAGVALEISTAGLRKPVAEIYPDPRLLRLSAAPITLASDAHEPQQVGEDFQRAVALARQYGHETVTVFDARVSRQEPLG